MAIFTFEYWMFISILLILFWLLPEKYSKYIMVIAGILVCASFGYGVLWLALCSSAIAYIIGLVIVRSNVVFSQILMWIGVSILVSIIILSKLELVPTLGVSFYSFRLISYIVDAKRTGESESNYWNFMYFALFFPVFVAGPIVRYSGFKSQLKRGQFDYDYACCALYKIAFGVFQKAYMADKLSLIVEDIYTNYLQYNGVTIGVAAFLYSFQIYFDFAGYSNIAIGVAQLFGIRLDKNFEGPFFAVSTKELWRRWHISLSKWLKDYVYIPLGGKNRKYVNILITFVISGLWHGTGTGYLVWGLLTGIFQVVGEWLLPVKKWFFKKTDILWGEHGERMICCIVTFFLFSFTLVFFKITDAKEACKVLIHMVANLVQGEYRVTIPEAWGICQGIAIISFFDYLSYKGINLYERLKKQGIMVRLGTGVGIIAFMAVLFVMKVGGDSSNFIYAKF